MKDRKVGADAAVPSAGKTLWVYGYEMIPPHQKHGMKVIRGLLNEENSLAEKENRSWTARLVTEQRVTHVLIVASSPEVDKDINHRIESKLKELGFRFQLSIPMPVPDGAGRGEP